MRLKGVYLLLLAFANVAFFMPVEELSKRNQERLATLTKRVEAMQLPQATELWWTNRFHELVKIAASNPNFHTRLKRLKQKFLQKEKIYSSLLEVKKSNPKRENEVDQLIANITMTEGNDEERQQKINQLLNEKNEEILEKIEDVIESTHAGGKNDDDVEVVEDADEEEKEKAKKLSKRQKKRQRRKRKKEAHELMDLFQPNLDASTKVLEPRDDDALTHEANEAPTATKRRRSKRRNRKKGTVPVPKQLPDEDADENQLDEPEAETGDDVGNSVKITQSLIKSLRHKNDTVDDALTNTDLKPCLIDAFCNMLDKFTENLREKQKLPSSTLKAFKAIQAASLAQEFDNAKLKTQTKRLHDLYHKTFKSLGSGLDEVEKCDEQGAAKGPRQKTHMSKRILDLCDSLKREAIDDHLFDKFNDKFVNRVKEICNNENNDFRTDRERYNKLLDYKYLIDGARKRREVFAKAEAEDATFIENMNLLKDQISTILYQDKNKNPCSDYYNKKLDDIMIRWYGTVDDEEFDKLKKEFGSIHTEIEWLRRLTDKCTSP